MKHYQATAYVMGGWKIWSIVAARRLAAVIRWPSRCNDPLENWILQQVKRSTGGEALWMTRARVERSLAMTGHAIARGHQADDVLSFCDRDRMHVRGQRCPRCGVVSDGLERVR